MAYIPRQPPSDPAQLPGFLHQELGNLARAIATPFAQLDELHAEPVRPRPGMVALADGYDWDPGAGPGFYGYRAGGWKFLG